MPVARLDVHTEKIENEHQPQYVEPQGVRLDLYDAQVHKLNITVRNFTHQGVWNLLRGLISKADQ